MYTVRILKKFIECVIDAYRRHACIDIMIRKNIYLK